MINGLGLKNIISVSDVAIKYCEPKSEWTYKEWISEYLQTCNYPPALLIASFIPYLLPLIDETKRENYDIAIYLVGPSGSGKSSIAKLFITPFEDNVNRMLLASDKKGIEKMSRFCQCSILFDDLNASDSDQGKSHKIDNVTTIIHDKQSAGSNDQNGKNAKISATPFFTAEFVLKKIGDINRCLVVPIDDSFDTEKLTWLQENHDTYISFLYSFKEYICMNFDELQTDINEYLSTRKYHMKDGEDIPGWQRISNIQFILKATLKVVMKFFGDKDDKLGCFPSFWDPFKKSIQECKEYTADLIRKRSMDKEELKEFEINELDEFLKKDEQEDTEDEE